MNDGSSAIANVIHIDAQGVLHEADQVTRGAGATAAVDLSFQGNSGSAVSTLFSSVTENALFGGGAATATTSSTVDNGGRAIGTAASLIEFELTEPRFADFSAQFTGDTERPAHKCHS